MGLVSTTTSPITGALDAIGSKLKNPFSSTTKGSEPPVDFPGGMEITEIVDGQERKADAIVLVGNMMPMQPFKYGGGQRIVKDFYPGNSEPATQVLGPKEDDVTIKGRFKSKHFQDKSLRAVAYEIAKLVDAMRIRGNLVKITMGEWRRYGFIDTCSFDLKTLADIDYEIKFSIVGFNPPKNCKFVPKTKDAPFSINKALISQALALTAAYKSAPASMPRSLAELMNDAISDVATAVGLVTNFVDTVVTTAENTLASANRAIGLIKNAKANISRFQRRVGAIVSTFDGLSSEAKAAAKMRQSFINQEYIMKAQSSVNSVNSSLARLQSLFETLAKTVPQARYRVHHGDTLQGISVKFYGTADNWKKIYDHNKLTTTDLTSGAVLEIPKL